MHNPQSPELTQPVQAPAEPERVVPDDQSTLHTFDSDRGPLPPPPPGRAPPLVQPAEGIDTRPAPDPFAAGPPGLPGYEILELLGRGGMGVVYKARHLLLNRLVALKVIAAGGQANAGERARFRTEAEAIARLQHPHVVQIYEVGEHQGLPYLALEFVAGGSLAERLDGTPLPARQAARLVADLAGALHAAHGRGLVHRDLKPANVLLTEDGAPKVSDFGLAKLLDLGIGPTASGEVLGTPSYMAPEQADSRGRAVGPAADVYALGAILYELLTGRPPFRAATAMETVVQVLLEEPVPPRRLQPATPRDLETICLKCLHKDPRRRYPSAAALAGDLERFLHDEPIRARPVGRAERVWRWAKHRPLAAALAGVSASAVLGLLALSLWYNARLREAVEDARASAARARRHQEVADTQRRRAEANLAKARAAVDQMLTEVGQTRLARVPQMEPVRRALLQKALAFYQGFLQERGEEPAIRFETARAYRRVADIHLLLGQHRAAEQAYAQAFALLRRLAKDHPGNASYRYELAKGGRRLGVLLREAGRRKEADTAYREALALLAKLVAEHPDRPTYVQTLALTHNNRGNLLKDGHHLTAAQKAYQQARTLQERLVARFPAVPAYRQDLAMSHNNLAILFRYARRLPKAEKAYRRSLAILEDLVHGHPKVPEYRSDLTRGYNNLANVLRDMDRFGEAEDLCRRALPLSERLADDFPTVPSYRDHLAMCHNHLGIVLQHTGRAAQARQEYQRALDIWLKLTAAYATVPEYQSMAGGTRSNLADLLSEQGEHAEARRLVEQAIRHQQAALKAKPKHPTYRRFLRNHYAVRTEILIRQGDHAEAVRSAREVAGVLPADGQGHWRAALLVAQCVPLAEKDTKLTESQRQELAEQYGRQAVALLRQGMGKGYTDGKGLEMDKHLVPLRSREDFRKLLAEAKAGAKIPGREK
jgi:serine/threonine-protein kinase